MKYIRTKDFIHDSKDVVVVNENGTLVVLRGIDKDFVERTHGRTWNTGTNVVLSQADNIEELCDEFVLFYDNEATEPDLTYRGGFNDLYFQNELKHSTKIYGAIWTDKGLIYVAKMNEEGVLCLI